MTRYSWGFSTEIFPTFVMADQLNSKRCKHHRVKFSVCKMHFELAIVCDRIKLPGDGVHLKCQKADDSCSSSRSFCL